MPHGKSLMNAIAIDAMMRRMDTGDRLIVIKMVGAWGIKIEKANPNIEVQPVTTMTDEQKRERFSPKVTVKFERK